MTGRRRLTLSYALGTSTPLPDGGIPVRIRATSRLADGAISDTNVVEFWNHSGTHIDGPAHVLRDKGALTNWLDSAGIETDRVALIDVKISDSRLITAEMLDASVRSATGDAELVLIRTGYSSLRDSDRQRYCQRNPGISVSAAQWIVDRFPAAKAVGIDSISFACMEHLAEGIAAHKVLLGRVPPVLLIEDLNLGFDLSRLRRVTVTPFMIESLDSCPCVAVAECD